MVLQGEWMLLSQLAAAATGGRAGPGPPAARSGSQLADGGRALQGSHRGFKLRVTVTN